MSSRTGWHRSSSGPSWSSGCEQLHRVKSDPARPVPAHLEHVVEVDEPSSLEEFDQRCNHFIGWQRTDCNERTFYPEFRIGQVEARVDLRTQESLALERLSSQEHRRQASCNR